MTPLIDNIPIPQTKSVKFHGVIVNQNLTWSEHITQITNKVSKNIGILSRISFKLPAYTLISLYYSLIYPYLAYCNIIWSSNYVTRISHLVTLQKAIRIITKSSYNSHTSHMFRKHSFLKIDQIKYIKPANLCFALTGVNYLRHSPIILKWSLRFTLLSTGE